MAAYLNKGSLIGVDGRIQTRSYEGNDGKRVYITEVFVDNLQFLESRQSAGQNTNYNQNYQNKSEDNFFSDFNEKSNGSQDILSDLDISDDELPF